MKNIFNNRLPLIKAEDLFIQLFDSFLSFLYLLLVWSLIKWHEADHRISHSWFFLNIYRLGVYCKKFFDLIVLSWHIVLRQIVLFRTIHRVIFNINQFCPHGNLRLSSSLLPNLSILVSLCLFFWVLLIFKIGNRRIFRECWTIRGLSWEDVSKVLVLPNVFRCLHLLQIKLLLVLIDIFSIHFVKAILRKVAWWSQNLFWLFIASLINCYLHCSSTNSTHISHSEYWCLILYTYFTLKTTVYLTHDLSVMFINLILNTFFVWGWIDTYLVEFLCNVGIRQVWLFPWCWRTLSWYSWFFIIVSIFYDSADLIELINFSLL